jgi:hypothetical protein
LSLNEPNKLYVIFNKIIVYYNSEPIKLVELNPILLLAISAIASRPLPPMPWLSPPSTA